MKRLFWTGIVIIGTLNSIWAQHWKSRTEDADFVHRAIKQVTDVMVYDIYSPPVTSRTYAYVSVAAYETLIQDQKNYISLAGQLKGLESAPVPDKNKEYSFTLAAVHAILTSGKSFVISEERIDDFEKGILQEFKDIGIPDEVFHNSLAYGKQVAQHILKWAAADKFKETRSLPQYSIKNDSASWKPTPPAYIKAIEPNWNRLRTFLIDSAAQFKPVAPPSFSLDSTSTFYKDAMAVYHQVRNNSEEEIEIAKFWDCNPFKMNVRGHVMYATKKISPNGHWMNITSLVCKQVNASAVRSAEAYACLAVNLADAFISCWDEKYRSVVIRPETYINIYIDPNWLPVLQTPPFPEYTSGHSVVSSSAAIMLTKLFGENFAFADSTEEEFGLPTRHFTSFKQAAEEAAISRFYGGIHYMPAIANGQDEGYEIGEFFIDRLTTRKK
ncbi:MULTISPECIES: vanadium-dependent haloperoxidase [unclassified Arenibacter]|uniref:vanadium-dependent haloperoxidase n=1 Tax=unclassified Arenibacter TaxID=2615047 RepID=UPI000E3575FD|nr:MULTISPECIES: vanadium-dependent haloperoxidase [unclassified Arenibacter]MCM4164679.1 phosphatidic acid phosphatase [Arenibacter sp. A80]RFT55755.1 phosphatase PAP2 family protein [Arenibacter sp. P308M17]